MRFELKVIISVIDVFARPHLEKSSILLKSVVKTDFNGTFRIAVTLKLCMGICV